MAALMARALLMVGIAAVMIYVYKDLDIDFRFFIGVAVAVLCGGIGLVYFVGALKFILPRQPLVVADQRGLLYHNDFGRPEFIKWSNVSLIAGERIIGPRSGRLPGDRRDIVFVMKDGHRRSVPAGLFGLPLARVVEIFDTNGFLQT